MILNSKTTVLTTALCALSVAAACAQTTPVHHSLLGKLLHHKPAASKPMAHHSLLPFHKPMASTLPMHHAMTPMHHGMMPMHHGMTPMHHSTTATSGQIIGNKHSHVFHMPGQPGALPAPQNRVYFSSVAAAEHAGYHAMGSTHKSMSHSTKHMTMKHK